MFSRKILVKKLHVFSRKVVRYGRKASPIRKNKVDAKVLRYDHKASPIRKNNVDAKVLWSELDENLLGEIMSRLSLTDQARFHAVCKRWHSVRPITTYKSLPWFVSMRVYHTSLRSFSLNFSLYEPYSGPRFRISIYKISSSKLGIPSSFHEILYKLGIPSSFHEILYKLGIPSFFHEILYIARLKHHWLFISLCQTNRSGATYSFVFSPLTRKFIQLPKLDYQLFKYSSYINLTFSTNPDSPDCVFFISIACDEPEFIVMTCCQGDKEWTIRKFDNIVRGIYLAEYINGTFLFVYPSGELLSYNIMNGEFEIEKVDRDDDLNELSNNSQMDFLMFELNGELTVLYIGFRDDHARGDNTTFPGIPCIKKFDWSTRAWVPLRSLGDQTLFVGHGIKSTVKVGMEQARNMGVLSNAIYYYFDLGCIIYSFENGVLVQLKYNPASTNPVKSGDLLQLHFNSAIRDKNHFYYLLQPPVLR